MLILNHAEFTPLNITYADSKTAISDSLPNTFLVLNCKDSKDRLNLAKFAKDNHLSYCCLVENIKEALFLVNLNAHFLLCKDLEFAKVLQKLAENYLFDAKILLCIKDENAIEEAVKYGIDGVIFANI